MFVCWASWGKHLYVPFASSDKTTHKLNAIEFEIL